MRMASEETPTSWSLTVITGPSSEDNLLTTLVSWARHRGQDPHRFHLSMHDGGRTLYLRGFDPEALRDFLRYAEYSSIPALECTPPRPMATPPPNAIALGGEEVAGPGPPTTEEAHHPSSLSAASIQMVMGAAQILADRATDVRSSEHWVAATLGVPEVKPEHVGLLLRLIGDPTLEPARLALAESEMLRREGSSLLKVPAGSILDVLALWLGPGGFLASSAAPAPSADGPKLPPRPPDQESLLKAKVFAKALEAQAQHWKEVGQRVKTSQAQGHPGLQSLVEGAVFINEEEGNVQWVVPSVGSPVVKALTGYVEEAHRLLREEVSKKATEVSSWVTPPRRETFCALETARRATLVAGRLGVEFRWVILLSTAFAEGKEPSFGLPVGTRPPWDAPAPSAAPAAPAPVTGPAGAVKRVTSGTAAAPAPAPSGFSRFSQGLDSPLDPWLQRIGVDVGLLKVRRKAPAPATAPPPTKPAAPAKPAASPPPGSSPTGKVIAKPKVGPPAKPVPPSGT
jgi:hypothetical protein